jgi:hypothetical protein
VENLRPLTLSKRTSVVDISGNFEESLIQFSRHLGTDKMRRSVFDQIYGRGTKAKSKRQIMAALGLLDSKSQQVQNALEELSRHHLISKSENDGSVNDGSRYLYGKEETVRANRAAIVKFADNKGLADRTPTKRRPSPFAPPTVKSITVRELRKRKRLVVLFLTSNPVPEDSLRVDGEVRLVQAAIRGSKFRENVSIEYRPAADVNSILDGLNDLSPQIVHFSGHGNHTGLVTDDGSIVGPSDTDLSYAQLAKALAATDNRPSLLVLNSCWGSKGKNALTPVVPFLISMNTKISDLAASVFAPRFYAAIASGQSIKSAFDQAALAVEMASISESNTPELSSSSGSDPAKIILT